MPSYTVQVNSTTINVILGDGLGAPAVIEVGTVALTPTVIEVQTPGTQGPQGNPGQQGDPGPSGADGGIGVDGNFVNSFEGETDGTLQYAPGSLVTNTGSTYLWDPADGVSLSPLGQVPPGEGWYLVAAGGDDGAEGPAGSVVNEYYGDWEAGEYPPGALVTYSGTTYINGDRDGSAPTSAEPPAPPWAVFAAAGVDGDDGDPGADGDSAYQVALDNGFVGSEAAWLASLEGAPGADGSDANVTSGNIAAALGYTPADDADLTAHVGDTANPHATTKAQVGLGNADNTSDVNKPVSTAQQTALDLKANAANAALTGVPVAPTAAVGTSTTQLATTAFVADKDPNNRPLTWGGSAFVHPFHGIVTGARQTVAPTADRNWYLLGRPIGRVRVSDPVIEVVAGVASATARAGMCEWDAVNGQPGPMVVDWGAADCSVAGTRSFASGATTVDLDPNKAYAKVFNIGPAASPQLYYSPFAPDAVPITARGTSQMVISVFDASEAAQRTGGFDSPPSVFADLTLETSANATGWRDFFQLTVVPIP